MCGEKIERSFGNTSTRQHAVVLDQLPFNIEHSFRISATPLNIKREGDDHSGRAGSPIRDRSSL
jgi:hypothetical protein